MLWEETERGISALGGARINMRSVSFIVNAICPLRRSGLDRNFGGSARYLLELSLLASAVSSVFSSIYKHHHSLNPAPHWGAVPTNHLSAVAAERSQRFWRPPSRAHKRLRHGRCIAATGVPLTALPSTWGWE